MTVERDLDFRVAAWLDGEATSSVPETLLDRSLMRVAATRQRPGWLVGRLGPARLEARGRLRRMALLAAAVALVGLILAVTGGGPHPVPTPSPSPLASDTLPSVGSALPVSLRATWVGATRTTAAIEPPIIQSAFGLTGTRLQYFGGAEPILGSAATWLGDDRITFRMTRDESGCQAGDLGTYTWVLSETRRALTLTTDDDPCRARSDLMSGDWTLADCPNTNSLCLGDLDPGPHVSAQYNPFVPRSAYVYDYGRLSYTVAEGWTNTIDGPDGFSLGQTASPQGGAIWLFSTAMADSQAVGCPGTLEPGVGRSASALSTWLSSLPGVTATAPAPVTVGGLSGRTLDVTIKPSWTRACPFSGGTPYVAMFTNNDAVNNFDWGLAAGGKMRLFLLDLPDGRTTLIDIEAPSEALWDAFVADAMPVIETFDYRP